MDSGVCFSPGALALLAACWAVIQGTIVTLFWLLIRSYQAQIVNERAEKLEWRRVAVRGADEIIPPLASVARTRVQEHIRELREPLEPQ